jgi:hypothetical protein
MKLTLVILEEYYLYLLHTKFYPVYVSVLTLYVNDLLGIIIVDSTNRSTIDQTFYIRQLLKKMEV